MYDKIYIYIYSYIHNEYKTPLNFFSFYVFKCTFSYLVYHKNLKNFKKH